MITLRDYQKECLDVLLNNKNSSKLVVLPTGSGKTVIFLSYLLKENKKSLILAHTIDLIKQTHSVLKKMSPDTKCAILKKNTDIDSNKIIISTIQSTQSAKALSRLKAANFDIIIIDEAHHSASESYLKLINSLGFINNKKKKLIGFTATPVRGDGKSIRTIFNEEVYRKDILDLVDKGILTDIIGYRVKTGTSLLGIHSWKGDFNSKELTAAINTDERNAITLKSFLDICPNKKTIIFCASIIHAKNICEIFQQKGISCKAIHGKLKREEREQILSDFKQGKIQVVTNCQLLTEGFDEPSVEALIMARPTKSFPLYMQMLGRGIRTFPGKKNCVLIELTDNSPSVCTLSNIVNENAEKFCSFEDGESLTKFKRKFDIKHAECLPDDYKIVKEEFNPYAFLETANQITSNPATQNQIDLLNKLEIEYKLPLNYTMALVLIKNHRIKNGQYK